MSLALIFAHTRIRNVDLILCRSSSVWRGCKGLVKTSLGSLVGYIFMRCFVGRAVEILSCLVKGLHIGPIYLVHPLLVLGCEVKVFVEAASSGPCSWICRGLSGAFNAFYYFSSFKVDFSKGVNRGIFGCLIPLVASSPASSASRGDVLVGWRVVHQVLLVQVGRVIHVYLRYQALVRLSSHICRVVFPLPIYHY